MTVHAYGAAMFVMVLTVALGGWGIAIHRKLPVGPSLAYCLTIAVAMPLGSRVLYWATRLGMDANDSVSLLRPEVVGFRLVGGFLMAIVVGLLLCRLLRLDPWRMADVVAPALGVGGAILRLGCFLNGCCFGLPTSMPWGMTFPLGSPAHLHQAAERLDRLFAGPLPVHPTQLYEMAASLLAAGIALATYRLGARPGAAALLAGAWFLAFRWGNSCLRAPSPTDTSPWWLPALGYAGGLLICGGLLWLREHPRRS